MNHRLLLRLIGFAALLLAHLGLSCVGVASADAAVPPLLQAEMVLRSAGGGPVPDGNYICTLSLFAAQNGGQPLWVQGPALVAVKSGLAEVTLGTKTPLTAELLATGGWLEMTVDPEPPLPRVPLRSTPFALRAAIAESLDCSGCIGAAALAPSVLQPYAKTVDLAPLATKAEVQAQADGLAVVAKTGSYKSLSDLPLLSEVAKSGVYADLDGKPTLPQLGKACGSGLVMRGMLVDGSYDCVAGFDPKQLPKDALDQVSNGVLTTRVDSAVTSINTPLPLNDLGSTSDSVSVPDLGQATGLSVQVELTNSDISKLRLTLIDPKGASHVLHDQTGSGGTLKAAWPPLQLVSGNLAAWLGNNPKGAWQLKVEDLAGVAGGKDGQIAAWGLTVQTLSADQATVKGRLVVQSSIQLGDDAAVCSVAKGGTLRWTGQDLMLCNGVNWRKIDFTPPPSLAGVAPRGGVLAGGTTVTLSGQGFAVGAQVNIGGKPCTNVQVKSQLQLTCTTPAGASPGSKDVEVVLIDGQKATLAGGFGYELNGLVAWFDAADEVSWPGSGSTWLDLSGNATHAKMVGGLVGGTLGGAKTMIFNGTGAGAQFANNKLATQKFGAIYWVYSQMPVADNNTGGLYVNRDSTVANASDWVWFGKWSDDQWYFRVNQGSCCNDLTGSGAKIWSSKVTPGKWVMVYFGYEVGAQGGWKWSVNGVNVSQGTLGSHPNSQTSAVSTIGWGHDGSGSYWQGGIASTRFYDRNLSDAEVQAEFARLKGSFGL